MREIVLDTETTGLDPAFGHRIVEIGCVELYNHVPTQRTFHCYVNPERDMPEEAFRVTACRPTFWPTSPASPTSATISSSSSATRHWSSTMARST